MKYDKKSFLAGISVGTQLKGWASVGGSAQAIPQTTEIGYADFDNGNFTETLETGEVLAYSIEFASGYPIKITNPDGDVTQIDWGW